MKSDKMSMWSAVALAVGTMIGASIFSIFGVGASLAGRNLPIAFIVSGLFAVIVAYSYAKMGSKIVSNAGPIAFIMKGFGDGMTTGTLSVLMWISYVVSIALFAKGFSGYFVPLLGLEPTHLNVALVEAGIILLFMSLNFFGSKSVGKAEVFIVMTKLSILFIFIIFGLFTINPSYITPSFSSSAASGTLNAAVVFFLSYMGFGLVTNASENMKDPEKNVPKAIYISIAIVAVVYVLVSLVAVGNLTIDELIAAQENTLAVAAKPFLGDFGFLLISIGALFSISSAINATLYGGANIAYTLAKDGELPQVFERKVWFGSSEGLYITAGLALILALVLNIDGIASITSAVFIVIYIFVIVSHYRLADEVGGRKKLLMVNATIISVVFVILMYYQFTTQSGIFYSIIAMFALAYLAEYLYRKYSKREFTEGLKHRD